MRPCLYVKAGLAFLLRCSTAKSGCRDVLLAAPV